MGHILWTVLIMEEFITTPHSYRSRRNQGHYRHLMNMRPRRYCQQRRHPYQRYCQDHRRQKHYCQDCRQHRHDSNLAHRYPLRHLNYPSGPHGGVNRRGENWFVLDSLLSLTCVRIVCPLFIIYCKKKFLEYHLPTVTTDFSYLFSHDLCSRVSRRGIMEDLGGTPKKSFT